MPKIKEKKHKEGNDVRQKVKGSSNLEPELSKCSSTIDNNVKCKHNTPYKRSDAVSMTTNTFERIMKQSKNNVEALKKNNQQLNDTVLNGNKKYLDIEQSQVGLQAKLKTIDKEFAICKVELEELKEENKKLINDNIQLTSTLTKLESHYDKEIVKMNSVVKDMEEELKLHKMHRLDLMEEFAKFRSSSESKMEEQKQLIVNMKYILTDNEKDLQYLREANQILEANIDQMKNEHEKELEIHSKNFEIEIESFKNELLSKNEEISKILQEKNEIEQEKNKTIDELTYKIRKIENVFGQPVRSVSPFNNALKPIQANNQNRLEANGNLTDDSAPEMPPVQRRAIKQSQQKEPQQQSTGTATATNSRRRKAVVRYLPSTNDFASDDTNDENWVPRPLTSFLPKTAPTGKRNRSTVKDAAIVDVVIPCTSPESVDNFERIKRAKI